MFTPKLGKIVWRVRQENDGVATFVDIQSHRIIAWDDETIAADTSVENGERPTALYLLPHSEWFADKQTAANYAHGVKWALEKSGKAVQVSGDLPAFTGTIVGGK